MFQIYRAVGSLALLIGIGVFGGCAGGTLGRLEAKPMLPPEVPREMQEKFEVKDATLLVPSTGAVDPAQPGGEAKPSLIAPAQAIGKGKRGRKKGAKGAVETAAAETFVYPVRRPAKDPIWLNEQQVFEITYFGMVAGDFTLDVLPYKAVNSRKVYDIRGTAISSKIFSLFYRLNDTVESFIDYDGFFSHRFEIILDETKQTRDALELYDSQKAQTFYWNRWKHRDRDYVESKEFQPMTPFPQDSVSALYYIRTVPLPTGATLTFPVVSEGKTWEAVVTVVKRELMDSPMGKVMTVVVKPETRYQGVLQKRGDSFIWLTDDDRRFVVRLEAKVRIGTVVANLKKVVPGTPPQ